MMAYFYRAALVTSLISLGGSRYSQGRAVSFHKGEDLSISLVRNRCARVMEE